MWSASQKIVAYLCSRQIHRKDRLNDSVFLSLCTNGLSYLGKETQSRLCINNAKLRSGVRDQEWNKDQLLHRIQSVWTSLIYNKYSTLYLFDVYLCGLDWYFLRTKSFKRWVWNQFALSKNRFLKRVNVDRK